MLDSSGIFNLLNKMPIMLRIPVALSPLWPKENGRFNCERRTNVLTYSIAQSDALLLQNTELYSQPVRELVALPFLQKTTANPVGSRRKSAQEGWEQQRPFGSSGPVLVSSLTFCFEGKPKKSLVPNPFPGSFTATAQRLQSC